MHLSANGRMMFSGTKCPPNSDIDPVLVKRGRLTYVRVRSA